MKHKFKSPYTGFFVAVLVLALGGTAVAVTAMIRDRDWTATSAAMADLDTQNACYYDVRVQRKDGELVGKGRLCESRDNSWTPLMKMTLPGGKQQWQAVCVDIHGTPVPIANSAMNKLFADNGKTCPGPFEAATLLSPN